MDLDLTIIGWLHGLLCLVAMAAFVLVMVRRKGTRQHRAWGQVFTVSYAAVCLTALGIYRDGVFFFPHWLAVIGLVVILVGWLAARFKPPAWRYVHLICMLLSGYNLFGGAVNEAFLRINALKPLVGPNFSASPAVGQSQGAVMLVFVLLIVTHIVLTVLAWSKRTRKGAGGPAGPLG